MLLIPMANLKVMKRNINKGTPTNLQVLEESQGRSHGNCQGLHAGTLTEGKQCCHLHMAR